MVSDSERAKTLKREIQDRIDELSRLRAKELRGLFLAEEVLRGEKNPEAAIVPFSMYRNGGLSVEYRRDVESVGSMSDTFRRNRFAEPSRVVIDLQVVSEIEGFEISDGVCRNKEGLYIPWPSS